jgi:hypothetical protein
MSSCKSVYILYNTSGGVLRCCLSDDRPHLNFKAGQRSFVMAGAKYALVTGGNRGIGLEVCKQLVAKGKPVLFTARNAAQGGHHQ